MITTNIYHNPNLNFLDNYVIVLNHNKNKYLFDLYFDSNIDYSQFYNIRFYKINCNNLEIDNNINIFNDNPFVIECNLINNS